MGKLETQSKVLAYLNKRRDLVNRKADLRNRLDYERYQRVTEKFPFDTMSSEEQRTFAIEMAGKNQKIGMLAQDIQLHIVQAVPLYLILKDSKYKFPKEEQAVYDNWTGKIASAHLLIQKEGGFVAADPESNSPETLGHWLDETGGVEPFLKQLSYQHEVVVRNLAKQAKENENLAKVNGESED